MRKSVAAAIIALVLLLSQGCAPKTEFRTLKQILSAGTLNVFVNPAGEPFSYTSAGEAMGAEVDFMRAFAEYAGVEAVFTITDYDGVIQGLNTGEADVAIGKMTLAGEGYPAGYSLPIASDRMYIICARGEMYGDFASLDGKKVGMLGDRDLASITSPQLSGETESVQLQSAGAAADYLIDGTVDAVICMRADARRLMEEYGGELYCENIAGMEPLRYAAVVARGNDTLLAAINGYITESMMEEASYDNQEEPS